MRRHLLNLRFGLLLSALAAAAPYPARAQDSEVKLVDGPGYTVLAEVPRSGRGGWCRLNVFINIRATTPAPFLGERTELTKVVQVISSQCREARIVRLTGYLGDRRVYTGAVNDLTRSPEIRHMSTARDLDQHAAAPVPPASGGFTPPPAPPSASPRTSAPLAHLRRGRDADAPASAGPHVALRASGSRGLEGEWEARTVCSRAPADALLKVVPQQSGEFSALLEIYPARRLVGPVQHADFLARFEPSESTYRFVPARPGQGLAFSAKLSQDGAELAVTGGPCDAFTARPVLRTSATRLPSVPTPAGGGAYRSGANLEQRCNALIEWTGRIGREHPQMDMRRTELSQLYDKTAFIYADDDFVPVFGTPFDAMDDSALMMIWRDIAQDCRKDPFLRDKGSAIWGHPLFDVLRAERRSYYAGDKSAARIVHLVRSVRRIRNEVKLARTGGAGADFQTELRGLLSVNAALASQPQMLWPSELTSAQQTIARRLNMAARKEGDSALVRIAALKEPEEGLRAARDALDPKPSGFFTHLSAEDKADISRRTGELQSRFAAQAIAPLMDQARAAPVSVDGAKAMAALISGSAKLMEVFAAKDRDMHRAQLEKRRDEIIATLLDVDLSRLKALPAGLEGLRTSAQWIADHDRTYAEFATLPALKAARAAFVSDRAARLRSSVDEFAARLTALGGAASGGKSHELVNSYLSWAGDKRLPESLEYDFVAAQKGFF